MKNIPDNAYQPTVDINLNAHGLTDITVLKVADRLQRVVPSLNLDVKLLPNAKRVEDPRGLRVILSNELIQVGTHISDWRKVVTWWVIPEWDRGEEAVSMAQAVVKKLQDIAKEYSND